MSINISGMIAGAGVGLLRSLYARRECVADLIPVDAVINVMCVAAAAVAGGSIRSDIAGPPVLHCTSGSRNPITWGQVETGALKYIRKHPMEKMFW